MKYKLQSCTGHSWLGIHEAIFYLAHSVHQKNQNTICVFPAYFNKCLSTDSTFLFCFINFKGNNIKNTLNLHSDTSKMHVYYLASLKFIKITSRVATLQEENPSASIQVVDLWWWICSLQINVIILSKLNSFTIVWYKLDSFQQVRERWWHMQTSVLSSP